MAFQVNPADGELRDAERTLIYSLVDRARDDQATAMLETLRPWHGWAFEPEDPHTAGLKKELRDECVRRLLPKVERAFVAYIDRPESLRLLSTPGGSASILYVLFSPDRLPWGTVIRNALLGTIRRANSDLNAYEKVNEFLQLLVQAGGNASSYIPRQSAERIVADREFLAAQTYSISYVEVLSFETRGSAAVRGKR
jgi:hypothetical protein